MNKMVLTKEDIPGLKEAMDSGYRAFSGAVVYRGIMMDHRPAHQILEALESGERDVTIAYEDGQVVYKQRGQSQGKSAEELAAMKVPEMLTEIHMGIGRNLRTDEELEIAMLSGAFKAGGGVLYSDLILESKTVTFPEYLRVLGYPLKQEE